jgi:membrane protein DedA with SNARE-associated domain
MRYFAIASLTSLGALGVPVPVPLAGVLVGAGVFAARGELCVALLIILVTVGAICGDMLGYGVGRFGAHWHARLQWQAARAEAVNHRAWSFIARVLSMRAVRRAVTWANERLGHGASMGTLIFLTRTVLGAFGPAVNVLSGVRAYPLARFLLVDVVGELIWVGATVGAGFVAGTHGHAAGQVFTHPLVIALTFLLTPLTMLATLRRPSRAGSAACPIAMRRRAS